MICAERSALNMNAYMHSSQQLISVLYHLPEQRRKNKTSQSADLSHYPLGETGASCHIYVNIFKSGFIFSHLLSIDTNLKRFGCKKCVYQFILNKSSTVSWFHSSRFAIFFESGWSPSGSSAAFSGCLHHRYALQMFIPC